VRCTASQRLAGLVSIFTQRQSGKPKAYGSVMYGSRNTSEFFAGYGGLINDYNFDFNVGTFNTDGFSAMNTKNARVNPDEDGYQKSYASLKLEKRLLSDTKIGLRTNVIRNKSDYDRASSFDSDTSSSTHREKKDVDIVSVYGSAMPQDQWKTNVDLSHSKTKYQNLVNEVNVESSRYKSESSAIRWFNTYGLVGAWLSNFGVDLSKDQHRQYGSGGYDVDRDTVAPFVGLGYSKDRLSLQANFRLDQIEITRKETSAVTIKEDQLSGLLGIGYQFNPLIKGTATLSTGFKAPAAYDISTNANIKSEDYDTKEVGVVLSNKQVMARFVYFDTSTKNAIDYDASYNAVNTLKIENKGVEASLKATWFGTSLKISAVSQNPKNPSTGERRARRAKEYGSIDLSREIGAYQVGGRLFAAGDRLDLPGGEMLGGYGVFSVYASKNLSREWVARLRFENVFDKEYEVAGGYNNVPRGVFLSVQYLPKD